MTLPVSMDDKELFPKVDILNLAFSPKSEINEEVFKQMFSSLDRLWWSRLVISVRGYVINYVQQNDEVLFSCDDAFIKIHQKLAERSSKFESAYEYLTAIFHIIREKNTLIQLISNPKTISTTKIPPNLDRSFGIVHGDLSPKAIQLTIDNRTWVLLDFDRYILQQWKPNGTSVIFGDRFVEKKKRSGLKLCTSCGMLEQKKAQFAVLNDQVYCSKTCFDEVNPPMTVNNRGATVVHL
ncbi:hypothetical protein L3Y34_012394 [Caenorhabditis briggsae]|uniref:DUF8117 domain-containing protein n=1 Tax=Caenorhabditis briggsae TaxID=6238 RepID=A0AAE8ZSB9_CAEBR|nr:hypothetical protein L3Y34_012394 [Caenorhabditis briggsae]